MTAIVKYQTQVDKVREHLVAGKSITPGHALLVYGISRLAVAIEKLRGEGLDIDMVLKEDESGKRYGEYRIRKEIGNGARVQVARGHGFGLPSWVIKTAHSKVVGRIQDVAYVQFYKNDTEFETIPLNVKELVHVG